MPVIALRKWGQDAQWARGRIVLPAAHVCTCAPLCSEPTHLLAMCQRCHLRLDGALHAAHAAETRRMQRIAQGQCAFW